MRYLLLNFALLSACAMPPGQPGQSSYYVDGATVFAPPGSDMAQVRITLDAAMGAVRPLGYPQLADLAIYLEPHRVSFYETGYDSVQSGVEVHAYVPGGCLADSDLAHALTHWMRWEFAGDSDLAHSDSRYWGPDGVAAATIRAQEQACQTDPAQQNPI